MPNEHFGLVVPYQSGETTTHPIARPGRRLAALLLLARGGLPRGGSGRTGAFPSRLDISLRRNHGTLRFHALPVKEPNAHCVRSPTAGSRMNLVDEARLPRSQPRRGPAVPP